MRVRRHSTPLTDELFVGLIVLSASHARARIRTNVCNRTLKYQAEIIGADVDVAISNENISGITLWHFYDFKVDNCGTKWPCGGSGGQENNTHCQYVHPTH